MRTLLFLILIIFTCTKASPWDNLTITIAVVEYQPIRNNSLAADELVTANTQKYLEIIKSVNETDLDMIIFPEATLLSNQATSAAIKVQENPCSSPNYPSYIRELSCAAKNASTYLVVNIMEKEPCNSSATSANCLLFGNFFYNTNLVFDRFGTIINRYRKYNLFMEVGTDRPLKPEIVVVETDFGINFGIFTCFDILFQSPAEDVVTKSIDAVIYPTEWHSELPFLTSIQSQQMWAQSHNIRLFAAGASQPSLGSGGSGIYSGTDGTLLSDIIANGGTQVYVYKYVPGEPPYNPQNYVPSKGVDVLGKEMDSFYIMPDSTITDYNSTILDLSNSDFSGELCYFGDSVDQQICCQYVIKSGIDQSQLGNVSYVYHLVAFSGIRYSFASNGGLEVCAVIACMDSSLSSCGQRFPDYDTISWPITFEEITIKSNFLKDVNRRQFPNSLLSSIRPINGSHTIWEGKEMEIGGKIYVERTFSVKEPQNRLMTFAILGRNFALDSN